MMKLPHLLETILAFMGGLVPGALGAAVGLAYEKGLTWTDRFTQFAVGVVVSYFARGVINALYSFDPFVLQGITFTLGMVAFKATPRLASGVIDNLADLPSALRDRVLPRKKDGL